MMASLAFSLSSFPLESYFFFFSSRRRHTRCGRDWSSDVCSSDLRVLFPRGGRRHAVPLADLEPLLEVFLLVEPGQEVLGELLVLRVLHDAVAVREVEGILSDAAGQRVDGVVDVLEHRLALLGLDLVL